MVARIARKEQQLEEAVKNHPGRALREKITEQFGAFYRLVHSSVIAVYKYMYICVCIYMCVTNCLLKFSLPLSLSLSLGTSPPRPYPVTDAEAHEADGYGC